MFSVIIYPFGDPKSRVPVSSYSNVEPALAFALELHRVSNLPHVIVVHNDSISETVVTLSLKTKVE